jgi:ribosomal protein L37AE/L43A
MYEVHAIEYKTIRGGSRKNAYCQICQLTEVSSSAIQKAGKCGTVWTGAGWLRAEGWHSALAAHNIPATKVPRAQTDPH